jgi:hypothetical protein
MRTLLGMILGCLLTVGIVYLHDMRASSTGGTAGIQSRQIVNWDVAQANWNMVADNARQVWARLKESIKPAAT